MKKKIFSVLFAVVLALSFSLVTLGPMATPALALNITTTASGGNWNVGSTWVGGAVPEIGDDAFIVPGATVTVTADATINSITFNNTSVSTGTLTVNTGVTLTVTAGITLQNASGDKTAATLAGAGTITCASVSVGGTTPPTGVDTYIATLTSTITNLSISGNLAITSQQASLVTRVNNAVFALNSGSVGVGGSVAFTTADNVASIATLGMTGGSANGTLTLSGGIPFTNSGNTGIPTFNADGTTATVVYSGAAQTVNPVAYRNLTLSGSDAKTLTGVTTINGNLTLSGTATATTAANLAIGGNLDVGSGTTFDAAEFALTVTGSTSVTGTLTISSATGTKAFSGNVTINNGGIWNNTAANAALTLPGSLQNDGTFSAGTGVHTFTGTSKTFSGANAISIPNITVSGTYQNNGTLTVGTALAGGGTLTNGATGTLNIGGTSTITGLTATASGNTVNYNGAAQTVKAVIYHHLLLSSNGAKTTTGATVNGILSMEGTTTASAAPTYGAAATLQYKGSGAQTTGIEFPETWSGSGGVKINNASGVTLNATKWLGANPLTIGDTVANSVFNDGGFQLTATGILNLTSGTFNLGTGGTATTFPAFATRNYGAGTTVAFVSGAAQTVAATSYPNLTFSGAGAKNAAGAINVSDNLTNSSVFDMVDNTLTVTGTTTNTGGTIRFSGVSNGLAISTGTVEYYGASQTVATGTYNNLTINQSSGNALLGGPVTVNDILKLTSGIIITTDANTMIIGSSGSVSGGSSGRYIWGNLQKNVGLGATSVTFEVGETYYNPVTVAFDNVTTAGNLTVKATKDQHPDIVNCTINSSKDVNVYWTLTNSRVVCDNYSATFNFNNPGDIVGGANPDNFIVGKLNGSWTYPTVGTKTSTSTQATGITSFSDFALGEPVVPTVTSITPNTGVNTGPVGITNLAGTNFVDGSTSVKLTKGVDVINATNVVVTGTIKITCDFDLTGAAARAWDVVVTVTAAQNPATFAGGFTVTLPAEATVTVGADPINIAADGASTSAITATVNDQYGNPVADGTDVVFITDHGILDSRTVTKQTSGGVATATITSEDSDQTVIATVTATAGGVSDATAVFFIRAGGAGIDDLLMFYDFVTL